MGVRLHKALGYGLTDVEVKDMRIVDPRINTRSFLLGDEPPQLKDYADFLSRSWDAEDFDARMEADMISHADYSADGLCVWNPEDRLSSVLVVRPACCPEWFRRATAIDYEEEALEHRSRKSRVQLTLGNISPYESLYMDTRTGEQITSDLAHVRHVALASRPEQQEDDPKWVDALDQLAKRLGYRDHGEASAYLAPLVPPDVRRLCVWGELFTGPDVWKQLRPVLYTYWS